MPIIVVNADTGEETKFVKRELPDQIVAWDKYYRPKRQQKWRFEKRSVGQVIKDRGL